MLSIDSGESLNFSCFKVSTRGLMRSAKWSIKFRNQLKLPIRDIIIFRDLGSVICCRASTFLGSTSIPLSDNITPKKDIWVANSLHLAGWRRKFASESLMNIFSKRQMSDSLSFAQPARSSINPAMLSLIPSMVLSSRDCIVAGAPFRPKLIETC